MGTTTETTETVSNKPRVLLVSPLPPPEGGIASWTQRILAAEAMQGVSLHHLNTSLGGGHHRLGAPLWAQAARSAALLLKFAWTCLRVWPAVVHITTSGFKGYYRDMFYVFFARLLGRKVVLNIRFGDVDVFLQGAPWPLKTLVRASLRSCWRLVVITGPASGMMRDLGYQRVEVIPNCVDLRKHSAENDPAGSTDGFRVLYVGWVIPAKGINELLAVVAQVDGATLTIIGPLIPQLTGGDGAWLNEEIDRLGLRERVTLTGRMDMESARRAYGGCDVFVLPSHREGFPNTILEAMEAGIPVIATRVGAIPEIVRDTVDGFLIDVGDTKALSGHLQWLRDNPVKGKDMGRYGRERVVENYSAERVADIWVDLYQQAAGHAVASGVGSHK